jgi:VanZ family protein
MNWYGVGQKQSARSPSIRNGNKIYLTDKKNAILPEHGKPRATGRQMIRSGMKSKTIRWILIIAWCGMIFYQSSRIAALSDKQSLYIVAVINHLFSVISGKELFLVSNHLVRKSAHYIEYTILGALFFNGFFSGRSLLKAFFFSLIAGSCYAASDELHQHFVPGRTMQAFDVFIDSVGVFCGAGLLYLTAWLPTRKNRKARDHEV